MTMTSIGDLAGSFTNRLNMMRVKSDLLRLSAEMSSGRPADPVAHLGGDTAQLANIERDIGLAQARVSAATGIGKVLEAMQTVMEDVEGVRSGLADKLFTVTTQSYASEIAQAGAAGAAAFRDIVARLNAGHAGGALFAGAAIDGTALADADQMLASLSAAAAGATTAGDVIAAVDAWFDDPAGGFATMGYLGDTGAPLSRRIDADVTLTLSPRADHPAFRNLMRTTAILALSADPALALDASTKAALVVGSLPDLMSAGVPLTDLRALTGLEEERAAEAVTRHGARATALTITRNELALVDPYATALALKETETRLETQFVLTSRLSGLSLVNFLK
jgi:flagellar hook-associated protein 3 FlgL